MTVITEWPRWFQPAKKQPQPPAYYLDVSPPRELPELVYPTPSEVSSPSGSSSSHVNIMFNPPILPSPSLSSDSESHPYQSLTPLPQKRSPNKLRKPSIRNSSTLAPIDSTHHSVVLPSLSQPIFSAPSSIIQYHSGASSPNLYRTTSTPTVSGPRSSLSTERATLYSRCSQQPLIPGPIRTVTRRDSPLASTGRKLTKPRPILSPIPSYHVMTASLQEDTVTSAPLPAEPPRRSATISFNLRKRWSTRPVAKLLKKDPSQRLSRLVTDQPPVVTLDEQRPSPLPQHLVTEPFHYQVDASAAWSSVERVIYNSPESSLDEHQTFSPPRRKLFTLEVDEESRFDHGEPDFTLMRPPLVRRNALSSGPTYERLVKPRPRSAAPQGSVRRRWTLALVMTDDGLTDEVFVQELERIRQEWHGEDADSSDSEDEHFFRQVNRMSIGCFDIAERPRRTLSQLDRDTNWPSALRALLITRDLLRTERNYLNSLHRLLSSCPCPLPSDFPHQNSETLPWPNKPPPEVMLARLLPLIRASTLLLNRIHEDPSVWGVSSAFVLAEDEIMNAYCGWCSEVGGWYTDSDGTEKVEKRRLSRARFSGNLGPSVEVAESKPKDPEKDASPADSESPRLVTAWRKVPSLTSLSIGAGSSSASLGSPLKRKKTKSTANQMLTVRELGILPVQRVTRYVLLFRDLLTHTPSSSPSHALVERAVEVATNVAERCDNLQCNTAFIRPR